jgi:hypothetical protein
LASAEAIELPGANSDALMRYALPMTNVTAIVSPSARPRPSMMPPITPTFVYGSTMFQTTSHVVAPRPYADSLSTARHDLEDVAHHRRDERNHHHRQDDAGRQHADAVGRALEERPEIHRSPNSRVSSGWT